MSIEVHTDENGETMRLKRIKNGRYTGVNFNTEAIENMPSFPLRDDDILLCSYSRSGCHWLWENLRMFLAGEIFKDEVGKAAMMMDIHTHSYFDDKPSPRILNNHRCFDEQPTDLLKGKTKVVLLYRNPKDVAVSYYHFLCSHKSYEYSGVFSNFLKRFADGNVPNNGIFEYLQSWEEGLSKHPNIPCLLVQYETLKANPISERRRIASFLGREYDDAFLQQVHEATSIQRMRDIKFSYLLFQGTKIEFRKGSVGDWKNYFSVAENEWFDEEVKKKLGKSKIFDFVYALE